jgi:hypothetical protein
MPAQIAAHPSFRIDPLSALFQEVVSARDAIVVARRAPLVTSSMIDDTRTTLLHALEAYAAALDARRLPVPYGILNDLRIQRQTLGGAAGAPR